MSRNQLYWIQQREKNIGISHKYITRIAFIFFVADNNSMPSIYIKHTDNLMNT